MFRHRHRKPVVLSQAFRPTLKSQKKSLLTQGVTVPVPFQRGSDCRHRSAVPACSLLLPCSGADCLCPCTHAYACTLGTCVSRPWVRPRSGGALLPTRRAKCCESKGCLEPCSVPSEAPAPGARDFARLLLGRMHGRLGACTASWGLDAFQVYRGGVTRQLSRT